MRIIDKILLVGITLGLSSTISVAADSYRWPKVAPLQESFYFPDARKAKAKIYIRGSDKKPLYLLQCYSREVAADPDFDYSGDFECRLTPLYSGTPHSTLLTDNPFQSRDWESRGRMLASELWGKCADYPGYGRLRHFRLRGMSLTFEFTDVRFASGHSNNPPDVNVPQLISFRFRIQVKPDETALSAIAEPIPFAYPRRSNSISFNCEELIRQHVPGVISEDYIQTESLQAPYPEIIRTEKIATIPDQPKPLQFTDAPLLPDARTFYLPILDSTDKVVYEFECSAYTAVLGNITLIGRQGISCGLFVVGKNINLLSDSVDPYSRINRAHILPKHLYGKCINYPEWGGTRQFDLRGMRLTMTFLAPIFAGRSGMPDFFQGGIKQVKLKVKVEPYPAATAPVAEPARYIDWSFFADPNRCDKVRTVPE